MKFVDQDLVTLSDLVFEVGRKTYYFEKTLRVDEWFNRRSLVMQGWWRSKSTRIELRKMFDNLVQCVALISVDE